MMIKVISPILLVALFLFSSCEDKTASKEEHQESGENHEQEKDVVLEPYTSTEAESLRSNVLSLLDKSEIMFEELFVLDSIDAPEVVISAKADSALEAYNSYMIQMKETSESARPETEHFIKSSGKVIYHFMTIAQVHKDYANRLSVYEDDWSEEDWNEWTSMVDPQYQDWIDAKEEFKAALTEFETANGL